MIPPTPPHLSKTPLPQWSHAPPPKLQNPSWHYPSPSQKLPAPPAPPRIAPTSSPLAQITIPPAESSIPATPATPAPYGCRRCAIKRRRVRKKWRARWRWRGEEDRRSRRWWRGWWRGWGRCKGLGGGGGCLRKGLLLGLGVEVMRRWRTYLGFCSRVRVGGEMRRGGGMVRRVGEFGRGRDAVRVKRQIWSWMSRENAQKMVMVVWRSSSRGWLSADVWFYMFMALWLFASWS